VITLTRREARTLRATFRRASLGIPHRGAISPLVLLTDGFKLRARHRYAGLAVEHARDAHGLEPGAVALRLDALADFEGRDDTPVELEAVALDRTVARWHDRGIPQSREYEVVPVDRLAPFPELPTEWSDVPPGLLDALAEASAVACHGSTRYALGCIQIRDRDGGHQVVATDGCQLLVQGGFTLPWRGDVLVNRTPLFGSRVLRGQSLSVGRTETHVVIRTGTWMLALDVRSGDRFPDVDRVLPAEGGEYTRLALDPDDAVFLLAALDRLPGADEANAPVTVDLNGRVAVRARGPGGPITELVLARSGYAGPPTLVQVNRAFLGRALRLGFNVLAVAGGSDPVVGRDGDRVFAWQPLSADSAIAPGENVTRIDSVTADASPAPQRVSAPNERNSMGSNGNGRHELKSAAPHPDRGTSVPVSAGAPGLSALIAEAEALHAALGDARTRAGRLTVAMRRYRRHERLVSGALASLKSLKLQNFPG
jgi:hypothetical protein